MAEDKKAQLPDNQIVIRDADGSYKVFRNGEFVPLEHAQDEPVAATPSSPVPASPSPKQASVNPVVKNPAPRSPKPNTVSQQPRRRRDNTSVQSSAPKPTKPEKTADLVAPATMPRKPKDILRPKAEPMSKPVSNVAPKFVDRQSKPQVAQQKQAAAPVSKTESHFAQHKESSEAETIVVKSGITFPSQEMRTRVVNALISHLKGVRKPFETKQTLMKPVAQGGPGLSEAEVDMILNAAGIHITQKEEVPLPVTHKPEIAKPAIPVIPPVAKDIQVPPKIQISPAQNIEPKPVASQNAPSAPSISLPKGETVAPVLQISDIQKPTSIVKSPIQELAYTLADWRRIGENPTDRMKKVTNQLTILEEEEYAKRIQGIRSWRQSEVMQLYLDMGRKSFEESKSLEEIMGSNGSLTKEEWLAVAEFNESIRF